jgi:hypothetical protein
LTVDCLMQRKYNRMYLAESVRASANSLSQ